MKLSHIAACLLSLAMVSSANAADFAVTFDAGYNPAAYPAVTATNYTLTANGLQFGEGTGVSLSGVLNSGEYTIDTKVSLDTTAYWRKLIDYSDRSSDNGLYYNNGAFELFVDGTSTYGSTHVADGEEARLTITRSASNLITAYLNGHEELSFNDATNGAVFNGPNNVAHLFVDDWVSLGYERSPGTVRYIQVFNHALDGAAVSALGDTRIIATPSAVVPEPETLAMILAGILTVGTRLKRRRA
ncbi:MAG: PEP-CTERM sorting domain-containing protein [Pseudomonadota bacterium]